MKVSLVIPASNEEKRIGKTLKKIRGFKPVDEVIVVSNGTDRTPEIVEEFQKKDRRIKILKFKERIGKGGAIKEGLKKSKYCVIVYDADGSIPLIEIEKMREKLNEGFDFVMGSRNLPESRAERSLVREVNSRFFNSLSRLFLKIQFRDTQCGFKAFSRRAVKLLDKTSYNGWSWDLNAIMIAKKNKLRIAEIPINWNDEKTDNWKGFKKIQLIGMIRDLIKMNREFA
jgi:glycosyltransferase involved in cell wall biosynthesis